MKKYNNKKNITKLDLKNIKSLASILTVGVLGCLISQGDADATGFMQPYYPTYGYGIPNFNGFEVAKPFDFPFQIDDVDFLDDYDDSDDDSNNSFQTKKVEQIFTEAKKDIVKLFIDNFEMFDREISEKKRKEFFGVGSRKSKIISSNVQELYEAIKQDLGSLKSGNSNFDRMASDFLEQLKKLDFREKSNSFEENGYFNMIKIVANKLIEAKKSTVNDYFKKTKELYSSLFFNGLDLNNEGAYDNMQQMLQISHQFLNAYNEWSDKMSEGDEYVYEIFSLKVLSKLLFTFLQQNKELYSFQEGSYLRDFDLTSFAFKKVLEKMAGLCEAIVDKSKDNLSENGDLFKLGYDTFKANAYMIAALTSIIRTLLRPFNKINLVDARGSLQKHGLPTKLLKFLERFSTEAKEKSLLDVYVSYYLLNSGSNVFSEQLSNALIEKFKHNLADEAAYGSFDNFENIAPEKNFFNAITDENAGYANSRLAYFNQLSVKIKNNNLKPPIDVTIGTDDDDDEELENPLSMNRDVKLSKEKAVGQLENAIYKIALALRTKEEFINFHPPLNVAPEEIELMTEEQKQANINKQISDQVEKVRNQMNANFDKLISTIRALYAGAPKDDGPAGEGNPYESAFLKYDNDFVTALEASKSLFVDLALAIEFFDRDMDVEYNPNVEQKKYKVKEEVALAGEGDEDRKNELEFKARYKRVVKPMLAYIANVIHDHFSSDKLTSLAALLYQNNISLGSDKIKKVDDFIKFKSKEVINEEAGGNIVINNNNEEAMPVEMLDEQAEAAKKHLKAIGNYVNKFDNLKKFNIVKQYLYDAIRLSVYEDYINSLTAYKNTLGTEAEAPLNEVEDSMRFGLLKKEDIKDALPEGENAEGVQQKKNVLQGFIADLKAEKENIFGQEATGERKLNTYRSSLTVLPPASRTKLEAAEGEVAANATMLTRLKKIKEVFAATADEAEANFADLGLAGGWTEEVFSAPYASVVVDNVVEDHLRKLQKESDFCKTKISAVSQVAEDDRSPLQKLELENYMAQHKYIRDLAKGFLGHLLAFDKKVVTDRFAEYHSNFQQFMAKEREHADPADRPDIPAAIRDVCRAVVEREESAIAIVKGIFKKSLQGAPVPGPNPHGPHGPGMPVVLAVVDGNFEELRMNELNDNDNPTADLMGLVDPGKFNDSNIFDAAMLKDGLSLLKLLVVRQNLHGFPETHEGVQEMIGELIEAFGLLNKGQQRMVFGAFSEDVDRPSSVFLDIDKSKMVAANIESFSRRLQREIVDGAREAALDKKEMSTFGIDPTRGTVDAQKVLYFYDLYATSIIKKNDAYGKSFKKLKGLCRLNFICEFLKDVIYRANELSKEVDLGEKPAELKQKNMPAGKNRSRLTFGTGGAAEADSVTIAEWMNKEYTVKSKFLNGNGVAVPVIKTKNDAAIEGFLEGVQYFRDRFSKAYNGVMKEFKEGTNVYVPENRSNYSLGNVNSKYKAVKVPKIEEFLEGFLFGKSYDENEWSREQAVSKQLFLLQNMIKGINFAGAERMIFKWADNNLSLTSHKKTPLDLLGKSLDSLGLSDNIVDVVYNNPHGILVEDGNNRYHYDMGERPTPLDERGLFDASEKDRAPNGSSFYEYIQEALDEMIKTKDLPALEEGISDKVFAGLMSVVSDLGGCLYFDKLDGIYNKYKNEEVQISYEGDEGTAHRKMKVRDYYRNLTKSGGVLLSVYSGNVSDSTFLLQDLDGEESNKEQTKLNAFLEQDKTDYETLLRSETLKREKNKTSKAEKKAKMNRTRAAMQNLKAAVKSLGSYCNGLALENMELKRYFTEYDRRLRMMEEAWNTEKTQLEEAASRRSRDVVDELFDGGDDNLNFLDDTDDDILFKEVPAKK